MKNIFLIFITVALGWALSLIAPWWGIVIAGFIVGLMNNKNLWSTFGVTFLGGAILWGGMAFWFNQLNDGILATKMGQLFGVGNDLMMVFITLIIGGLFAGLGGMCGQVIRGTKVEMSDQNATE